MYNYAQHLTERNRILAAMACVTFFTFTFFVSARAQEPTAEVRRILNDDSIRYEQKKEQFVELGKPAVPALVHRLGTGDNTTRFLAVEALGRIKDKRATLPLLSSLGSDNAHAILPALLTIADPRAEPTFMRIMTSQAESMTNRLWAAQGLIRFGSVTARRKAGSFVLDKEALREAHEGLESKNKTQFPSVLWGDVLLELGSDAALRTAARLLGGGPIPPHAIRLIDGFSALDKPSEAVIDGLFAAAGNSGEMHVRCAAIEALIGYGDLVSKEQLLQSIEGSKQLAEGWGTYPERLGELRARVMSGDSDESETPVE